MDTVGAFVDPRNTRITHQLLDAPVLGVTRATEHLQTIVGAVEAFIGQERLDHRGEQLHQVIGLLAHLSIRVAVRHIQVQTSEVGQRTTAFDHYFLAQQVTPHIGVYKDRVGGLFRRLRAQQGAALQALFSKPQTDLVSALGNPQALHADHQTGRVHHGKHALQALVGLTDQPALGAFKVHHTGGRTLDAHLMFQPTAERRVATAIGQELRHQKQGNTLHAIGRIRQLGQHQVEDVIDHVVLAAGDPDLGTGHGIAAVLLRHGAGTNQSQVGATLRLGQAHGAGPFAADQLRQVLVLQLAAAVLSQCINGAMGEARIHAQGQVGRADHLLNQHVQHMGQALTAELGAAGQRRPATFSKLLVGLLEALRHGDGLGLRVVLTALLVTRAIQRSKHVFGELGCFFQDCVSQITAELALIRQALQHVGCIKHLIKDKAHVT